MSRTLTEEEAIIGLVAAIIEQAVDDAKGKRYHHTVTASTKHRRKIEARRWLVEEMPYLLAACRPMDADDIAKCKEQIKLWIFMGMPQDGSFELGL